MLRSQSKDRTAAVPGPSYMSSEQKGRFDFIIAASTSTSSTEDNLTKSPNAAKYLHELRTNRVQRPTGARPPPSSFISTRDIAGRAFSTDDSRSNSTPSPTDSETSPIEQGQEFPMRTSSALSQHRSRSATPNTSRNDRGRPIAQPPVTTEPRKVSGGSMSSNRSSSVGYAESGKRMMERMEAQSLRKAMEELSVDKEHEVFKGAQDEAADLVWKHQNPNAPYQNPDAPYKYPGLSRKEHGRSQSVGGADDIQRANSKLKHRYSYAGGVSAITSHGGASGSQKSGSSPLKNVGIQGREVNENKPENLPSSTASSTNEIPADTKNRRRSSGSKRTPSGSLFRNPNDKIYEEPEEMGTPPKEAPEKASTPAPMPLQVRRNPFARVKFAVDQLPRSYTDPTGSKFDKYDIHKNPPSRSRNAAYTSNPVTETPPTSADSEEVKMKDGKEVRSDDIRAATSMKLKDRSQKLPTPTVVSDSPGRPIVSFQQDWKPKEVELKQEESKIPSNAGSPRKALPKTSEYSPLKTASAPAVPTIQTPESRGATAKEPSLPPIQKFEKHDHTVKTPSPTATGPPPPIPIICAPDDDTKPTIPTISAPDYFDLPPSLTIGVYNAQETNMPAKPAPSISVAPPAPTINISEPPPNKAPHHQPSQNRHSHHKSSQDKIPHHQPSQNQSSQKKPSPRPLPTPTASTRNFPRGPSTNSRPHWTPTNVRTGALCTQCALPISGRIVSAAGSRFHPECFACHHCAEKLECVAFYPEPASAHAERVARIQARLRGEDAPADGPSAEDDGDESPRFYCHLDFHEFFSPRCRSCKTPIEGEVVVACGAEWHVGHFFCAQCGDPFDASTPFVEKDGYAWCVGCHTNRYSTKCKGCRKPVTDTVVKALGAEWHQECFVCVECNDQFDDGRYFLRGDSQDPVCVRCEEARLKAY